MGDEGVAGIAAEFFARTAKALAGGATKEDVQLTFSKPGLFKQGRRGELADVPLLAWRFGKVLLVSPDRVGVDVGGEKDLVTGLLEAKGATACASKEADGLRCGRGLVARNMVHGGHAWGNLDIPGSVRKLFA